MTSAPASTLQTCNPLDDASWDRRIADAEGATLFHSTAWARVLVDTYGYTPCYVHAGGNERSPIHLPMMEVNSWLTGRRGISLPFTDECDALGTTAASFRGFFQEVCALIAPRRWSYFELRGHGDIGPEFTPSVSYFGHTLTLQRDVAVLFDNCESSVRRAVRKAESEGVEVKFSRDLPAIHAFYELLCRTRARHGLPPQPRRFFENIQRHILAPGSGVVAIARKGSLAIAGAVFFQFKDKVLYKFGASDERHQHLRGNNLVMWRAIERFAGEGFTQLDFGRTSLPNAGLRRFKLSWGTKERPINYLRYDPRRRSLVTSADEATGGWKTALFRRLPTGISRMIGTAAYRHIA